MAKVKSTAEKVQRRIENTELNSLGILSYDFDNGYTQRVIDITNDSGTAVTCLRIHSKFIHGNGASNVDFGSAVINDKGMTIDKLARYAGEQLAKFNGCGFHVNYNGLGQKVSVDVVPFEFIRLCFKDEKFKDKYAVYDDWTNQIRKKFDKKEIKYFKKFNPRKVLEQIEEINVEETGLTDNEIWIDKVQAYEGQLLYYTNIGSDTYTLAPYDSVLEDMQTEAQLKRFKHSTSSSNFLASHILVTGAEEQTFDDDGNEVESDEEGSVGDALKQFQGGDNAASILHLQKESDEETIELVKVDIQDYDGIYEYTENSSRESIRRPLLVPTVLIAEAEGSSIGESKVMADASTFYNDVTQPDRNVLEELLYELFHDFHIDINPSRDYSIDPIKYDKPIDPAYFQYYTKNEIRKANGSDEVDEVENLFSKLGKEAIDSINTIIANQSIDIESKKGMLNALFGIDKDVAELMMGTKTIQE